MKAQCGKGNRSSDFVPYLAEKLHSNNSIVINAKNPGCRSNRKKNYDFRNNVASVAYWLLFVAV